MNMLLLNNLKLSMRSLALKQLFLNLRNIFCILFNCNLVKLFDSFENILLINKLFYSYVLTEFSKIIIFFLISSIGFY